LTGFAAEDLGGLRQCLRPSTLDGRDLTQTRSWHEKATLKKILPKRGTGRVGYTQHVVGEGKRLFAELERRQLEGMVAKRADSLYVGGLTRAWLSTFFSGDLNQLFASFSLEGIIENLLLRERDTKHLARFR
jgi:hypothetical protein